MLNKRFFLASEVNTVKVTVMVFMQSDLRDLHGKEIQNKRPIELAFSLITFLMFHYFFHG
jgi:hypothetical protein